jgi:hypothetical protein
MKSMMKERAKREREKKDPCREEEREFCPISEDLYKRV